jgi:hypothetical protein
LSRPIEINPQLRAEKRISNNEQLTFRVSRGGSFGFSGSTSDPL